MRVQIDSSIKCESCGHVRHKNVHLNHIPLDVEWPTSFNTMSGISDSVKKFKIPTLSDLLLVEFAESVSTFCLHCLHPLCIHACNHLQRMDYKCERDDCGGRSVVEHARVQSLPNVLVRTSSMG
jgi:hypothetical protein